jgi:hypothetical protein
VFVVIGDSRHRRFELLDRSSDGVEERSLCLPHRADGALCGLIGLPACEELGPTLKSGMAFQAGIEEMKLIELLSYKALKVMINPVLDGGRTAKGAEQRITSFLNGPAILFEDGIEGVGISLDTIEKFSHLRTSGRLRPAVFDHFRP